MIDLRMGFSFAVLCAAFLGACTPAVAPGDSASDPAVGGEDRTIESSASGRADSIGSPALWSFSDADTTVYLFGTVHLLKPKMQWRSPEFEAAFEASDTIFFEADVESAEAQSDLLPLITDLGVYSGSGSLSATLNAEDEREVEEAAALVGVPMSALEPLRPWMAGIQLTNLHISSEGYDPASGVETILGDEAAKTNKDIGYFETAAQQLGFFAGLPEQDQIAFLVTASEQIEDDPHALDALVYDWARGDVEALAATLSDPSSLGSPLIYETLIVQRNRNWLPMIEAQLDSPGTKMIAVGAGHLAGEDGLVEMLRARGYVVDGP